MLEFMTLLELGKISYTKDGNTVILYADQASYTIGLKALQESSRFTEALRLFKSARDKGLIDGHLLHAALSMCNECGETATELEWQDIMSTVVKWQDVHRDSRKSNASAKPWFVDEHSRGIIRLVMKILRGRGNSLAGTAYFLDLLERSFYAGNLDLRELKIDVREFAFCTTLIVDTLNTSA